MSTSGVRTWGRIPLGQFLVAELNIQYPVKSFDPSLGGRRGRVPSDSLRKFLQEVNLYNLFKHFMSFLVLWMNPFCMCVPLCRWMLHTWRVCTKESFMLHQCCPAPTMFTLLGLVSDFERERGWKYVDEDVDVIERGMPDPIITRICTCWCCRCGTS